MTHKIINDVSLSPKAAAPRLTGFTTNRGLCRHLVDDLEPVMINEAKKNVIQAVCYVCMKVFNYSIASNGFKVVKQ